MKPSRFSVAHPVIISMTLLALAVFGIVSLSTMNVDFLGDINLPKVMVVTIYPGASAEEIEEKVTDVLEEDFVTLSDFKEMESQSINSASIIQVTFNDDADTDEKVNEVRNRINQLQDDLPDGISGLPQAFLAGTSLLPIATFTVECDDDFNALSDYIDDELLPQITRLEGVSSVTVNGAAEAQLEVKLLTDELEARGVSAVAVYGVLSMANYSIPLDSVSYLGADIDARYDSSFSTIEEIEDLPVGISADGGIIRIGDVAEVSFRYEDSDYYVNMNGEKAITVEVCKRSDGNTFKIVSQLNDIFEKEEKAHGGAVRFSMVNDDTGTITASLSTVIQSGVLGVLIAILVILLFLSDVKATIVIGISIPLSIFFAFIFMKISGMTINLLSLSGIVVALGNIVSASILVLDEVYRYYQQVKDGKAVYSVNDSIFNGSDGVMSSVIGSALTTIVVFIPITMLSGLVGLILKDIAKTFIYALAASLIVAIVYIPWFLKKLLKEEDSYRLPKRENLVVRGLRKLEKGYARSIYYTIDHKVFVIMVAVLVLVLSFVVLPYLKFAFIPSTDNSEFYISIMMPETYSVDDTREAMAKVERILERELPEMEDLLVYSGKSMSPTDPVAKKNQGSLHVVLKPVAERDRDVREIMIAAQTAIARELPDASVSVDNGGIDRLITMIAGSTGYGLVIQGSDLDELIDIAEGIEQELLKDPEVLSTSINSSNDNRQAVLNGIYDYMSSIGVSGQEAGLTSAIMFYGTDAGTFTSPSTGDKYDIHISSDITDESLTMDRLGQISLITLSGQTVPLSNVVSMDIEESVDQVNHTNRAMTVNITAQLTGESTDNVTARINRYLEENPLPQGVTTSAGGVNDLLADAAKPLVQALLIALFLVYLVMVALFERYDQPLLILLLFPFCLIGAVLALVCFNSSLSLVSILGIISLLGMLVNNGIVIAEYVNQLREKDRERRLSEKGIAFDEFTEKLGLLSYEEERELLRKTLAEGAASRLRSILMTTLTTVLSVVPMAISKGEGAALYAPLGQVIMGGLATSTVLTLYIMPVYYFTLEKWRLKSFYKKKAKEERGDEEAC